MTYESFLKVILNLQKQNRVIRKLYKLNLDLIEFDEPYHTIVEILIKEIYGDEGYEWFSWFCFENDYGDNGLTATDKDKNPIAHSFESLWELLESDYKINR
jgi:hypothetical protein